MPEPTEVTTPTTLPVEIDEVSSTEDYITREAASKIIRERLARQRTALETEFLGTLGVQSLDEAVQRQREMEQLHARVAEFEKREEALREQQAREARLAVVRTAMTNQGFTDPNEALVILPTLNVDVDTLVADDDVNREAFDALVARLREEKPHWFKAANGSPSNAGAAARNIRVDTEKARQEVIAKWRR